LEPQRDYGINGDECFYRESYVNAEALLEGARFDASTGARINVSAAP
jgi:hypothetical protein